MNCMKCGRDTVSERIFCEECLAEMEKYPVKPETAIKLPPPRENTSIRRVVKRRTISPEEQVKALKKRVRNLYIALILCLVLIVLLFRPAFAHMMEDHYKLGQNYSVVVTTTAPEETTEATQP